MKSQAEFDWNGGSEAKALGMELVLSNTREWWKANCYRLLGEQPAGMPVPFKGEDFKRYAIPLIGKPHHHNSWSAIWSGALKRGLVVATGEWAQCKKKSNHARESRTYTWPDPWGVEFE